MKTQNKKTAALLVALVIGGGLVGLGAHSPDPNQATAPAQTPAGGSETQGSYLDDSRLTPPSGPSLEDGKLFLKMIGSIVLVVALAIAALYVSKKVLPRVTNASGKEIRVMETAYLGPRKALHLVEIGHQKLLIGSTNENIATLAHIGEPWLDLSKQEIDHAVSP